MIELFSEGWASSIILLVTLVRQVYTQWRTHQRLGYPSGSLSASAPHRSGYIVYSFLLHNWVYVSSNIAILITAIVGEGLYLRNRRRAAHHTAGIDSSVQTTLS